MNKICGALVLLGLLSCMTFVGPAQADPAAIYRGGLGHTGYAPAALSLPVSLLWRHTTEASPQSQVSPVYSNGIIYFSAGQHVYALNAADGETVWRYPTTDDGTEKFASTPTVDGGAVYVGSDGGNLDKIDAKSGQIIWSKSIGGTIQGAPTADGDLVFFGSSDYHCYAVSAATGNVVWNFPTQGLVAAGPDVSEQNVYFASGDDSVYCLAKTTGKKVWSLGFTADPTSAPPVYADNVLYISAGTLLYAVNARSGEALWNLPVNGGVSAMPTVGPDFVGVAAQDGTFAAYSRQGRLRWRVSLGHASYGPALLTASLVLVPAQHGVIYALSADNGKLVWEYIVKAAVTKKLVPPTSTEIDSAPLLANRALYLLSDDGTLSALKPGVLDSLSPRVSAMVPEPGSAVNGSGIVPSATVADEGAGIDPTSVSMTLDGQPVPGIVFDAYKSQIIQNTGGANGTRLGKLDNGSHEIVVHATDWAGNVLDRSWGFFVDSSQAAQQDNGDVSGDGTQPGFGTP